MWMWTGPSPGLWGNAKAAEICPAKYLRLRALNLNLPRWTAGCARNPGRFPAEMTVSPAHRPLCPAERATAGVNWLTPPAHPARPPASTPASSAEWTIGPAKRGRVPAKQSGSPATVAALPAPPGDYPAAPEVVPADQTALPAAPGILLRLPAGAPTTSGGTPVKGAKTRAEKFPIICKSACLNGRGSVISAVGR